MIAEPVLIATAAAGPLSTVPAANRAIEIAHDRPSASPVGSVN